MILSIDIGTTSLSLVSCADDGTFLSARTFPEIPPDAEGCQDANAILAAVREAMTDFDTPDSIAVTGQMHGIVYLDCDGNAVSPLYGWQNPFGNYAYSDLLTDDCPNDRETVASYMSRRSGCFCATGYGLVTHWYLARAHRIPHDAVTLCTIGDFIAMKLAGVDRPLLHCSNAASLGLYDLKKMCFDRKALTKLNLSDLFLPEVVNSVTELDNGVFTAVGDNQASFAGSVSDVDDTLLINVGTGGQLSCLTDTLMSLPHLETRPYTDGRYLLNASSLCGGKAYAALADFFRETLTVFGMPSLSREDVYAVMGKWLEEKPCSSKGLIVDTAFCGTRSHPERRGVIAEIGMDTLKPQAFAEGFLRGIASEFLTAYEDLKTVRSFSRLALSGNAVRHNPYLKRCLESLYALPLDTIVHPPEEAAYGAARLVADVLKKYY